VVTRAWLLAAPGWWGYPHHSAVTGDVRLYAHWGALLGHGVFPLHDSSWQYPPGAGALLALPELMPLRYYPTFVTLALLADGLVTLVLLRVGARSGSAAGAWLWIVGTTALGPIVLNRFDSVPTLLAVAGLAIPARPFLAGALLGAGAAVKVWPALMLPVTTNRVRAVAGAVTVGLVGLASLAVTGRLGAGLDFLHNQQARGLQVETLAATPYVLARAFGAPGIRVVREFGAYQVHGPGVSLVVTVTTVAGAVVVLGYLALAWRRPGATGLGLAGLLAVLVTARVLSPQYLVWVLGVAAVVHSDPRTRQRLTAWLLVLACGLTQWLYPIWYVGLVHGAVGSALLLAGRNAVLLAACAVALRDGLGLRDGLRDGLPAYGMTRPIDTK